MNKFYEQFITKDYGTAPKIMQGLFWVFLGFSVFFLSAFEIIFAIFFIILTVALGLIIRNIFLEYEYEYYEGELTISKIINKKSRKIIGRFDIDKISKVSKPDNADKSIKIINACLKKIPNNKELIVFVSGSAPVGYYLSIDEKLFEILKREKPSIFNYI